MPGVFKLVVHLTYYLMYSHAEHVICPFNFLVEIIFIVCWLPNVVHCWITNTQIKFFEIWHFLKKKKTLLKFHYQVDITYYIWHISIPGWLAELVFGFGHVPRVMCYITPCTFYIICKQKNIWRTPMLGMLYVLLTF